MGDMKGFLKTKRQDAKYRPVCARVNDYKEVAISRSDEASKEQASRCMDCGTAFCHWACPIGNYIPEWNDLVFRNQWKRAFQLLDATNNLPEITGRLCPALCEYACVLGINDDPVTIRENELAIIEYGFDAGFIRANPPKKRTDKKIAIIGSGPAGLAVAAQLNKAGHNVTVFERDEKIGGILRFGIPDFKLEKWIIDRRINLLEKEGIDFVTNTDVGVDYKVSKLKKEFDVIVLTGGCRVPRGLNIPREDFQPPIKTPQAQKAGPPLAEKIEGRELDGIYFAMDYLMQSNRRVAKAKIPADKLIDAKGKKVVVIGGGDTGADCVGTANRQGASCVVQIEVMPKPSECRTQDYPWPKYPLLLKTSTSHEEGANREWCILTKKFIGENGKLKKLFCVRVEFENNTKGPLQGGSASLRTCPLMKEIKGSEFEIETDIALLAVGFIHTEHSSLLTDLGVEYDKRGNVQTDSHFMTRTKGVFSAGDMHRGQSLIVHAIAEGRQAAYSVDSYLMGKSSLPVI